MILANHQLGLDIPHVVNDASEQDINEGDGEVEEEPDVNHLDVGSDWKARNNGDKHTCEGQHHCEVDSDCGFKIKGFEVVGDVSNDVEEDRGNIDSCKDTQESSSQIDRS